MEEILVENDNIVILERFIRCGLTSLIWFENIVVDGRAYENYIRYILRPNEIEEELKFFRSKTKEYHHKNMIRLGQMEHFGHIILLGIGEQNADNIFIFPDPFAKARYFKIADDIFQFFEQVTQYWSDEDLIDYTRGSKNFENVYKNILDKEWRLKD